MTPTAPGLPGASGPDFETLALAAAAAPVPGARETRVELLALSLAGEPHAIAVERIREVLRLRPITALPRAPRALCGVIALRGEMLQVVDLRLRLGLPAAEPGRGGRIVVLHADPGAGVGLLVDGVSEVLRIAGGELRAPPEGAAGAVSGLCRHAGRFVSVLDLERVLELSGD